MICLSSSALNKLICLNSLENYYRNRVVKKEKNGHLLAVVLNNKLKKDSNALSPVATELDGKRYRSTEVAAVGARDMEGGGDTVFSRQVHGEKGESKKQQVD